MIMKYLDPKADLTFKKIFGNHPARLISLQDAYRLVAQELPHGGGAGKLAQGRLSIHGQSPLSLFIAYAFCVPYFPRDLNILVMHFFFCSMFG